MALAVQHVLYATMWAREPTWGELEQTQQLVPMLQHCGSSTKLALKYTSMQTGNGQCWIAATQVPRVPVRENLRTETAVTIH
jgi:hypothetical protein